MTTEPTRPHLAPVAGASEPNDLSVLMDLPDVRRRPSPPRKAVSQDNRTHNRTVVLALLYQQGPMSRADLVKASGLTATTVSTLIAELEGEGIVNDLGPGGQRRIGKPASIVEIHDGGANILAVELSHTGRFVGAVTDLRGAILSRAEVPVPAAVTADDALTAVISLVRRLMNQATSQVIGIGAASPGIVDDDGVVRYSAHPPWSNLRLAALLTDRFGGPVVVANDLNTAAVGAHWFRDTTARNLMVVGIEHGVGAGILLDGQQLHGERFAAGEIGHVVVDDSGPPCVCGRRGCLDRMISAQALRQALDAGTPDERSAVLADAGRSLGIVLAPVISALDITELALYGPPDLINGEFLAAAELTTKGRSLPAITSNLTVRSLAGDQDLILHGCVALVLASALGVL